MSFYKVLLGLFNLFGSLTGSCSLGSLGWPRTHYIDWAGLELKDPPTRINGLSTMPDSCTEYLV